MLKRLNLLLTLGLSIVCVPDASAMDTPAPAVAYHELDWSYMYLRVFEDSLIIRLEMTTRDIERALSFGWDPDAGVSESEVRARLGDIRAYTEERFSAGTAEGLFDPVFRDVSLLELGFGTFVKLEYVLDDLDEIPDLMDFTFTAIFDVDATHRNALIVEHNWKTATFNNEAGISAIFTPRSPKQSLDLSSASTLRGFIGLIWLGVLHIWIGIDHIFFLMALILPSVLSRSKGVWEPVDDFRSALMNIVTIVTFFTIAHSVTLAMAGLGLVDLPSAFVESVIAASIVAAAAANLVPRLQVKEWLVAFGFGLFHGFGFASVMGDIGVGNDHLVASVFGFNVGVELGQLAIILVVFPVLFFLRGTRIYKPMMYVGSVALMGVAAIWFGERAFGWDIYMTEILRNALSVLPGVG
jgi:hypothetical protein